MSRNTHDRALDHSGTQDDTTTVLSSAIGSYAAGTTVHDVLADLNARLIALNSANKVIATFKADAFILPHFWANAVIKRTSATITFTANADIERGFKINSVVRRVQSASLAADAVITL